MKKLCIYAAGILLLAGCENMGNLYPMNADDVSSVGIAAHFSWIGTDTGSLEVVMPSGEVMSGRFGPPYGNGDFGGIFKDVYGDYSTLPTAASNGSATVGKLSGNKGGSMVCEFYNDDNTDHGFGGCKTGTGVLYRLKY
jgi:hypothetical protein